MRGSVEVDFVRLLQAIEAGIKPPEQAEVSTLIDTGLAAYSEHGLTLTPLGRVKLRELQWKFHGEIERRTGNKA